MAQLNLSTQQKTDSKIQYQTCGWQGGEGGGGIEREFGISRCKLLHVEGINKVLLCGTVSELVPQSCQTPSEPMDCSPPGSSVVEFSR